MQTFRLRALAGLAIVAAACGGETVVNPTFGAGCSAGAISPGQVIDGVFDESSCYIDYNFWSNNRTPYTSYTVSLEKGKGYYFHLQVRPDENGLNDVDPLLFLYGKNASGASVPLAASDDDAEGATGLDSEFYFIAPRSGTFQLVTASYSESSLGGYRLRMERCPVLGTLDTAGTYQDLEFQSSNCIRRSTDAGGYTSPMVLFAVPVSLGEAITVSASGIDFDAVLEIGGPDFDVYDNLYEPHEFNSGYDSELVQIADIGLAGTYTLAVAADQFSALGKFDVTLLRSPAAAVLRQESPQAMLRTPVAPRVPKRR